MSWIIFALMTVASWGVYGVFLHNGQMAMGDPVNGRYKAFLFVGIAYFLTAVLAPLAILLVRGATWEMPVRGMGWSLVAGIVGAIGAFCVLLAFGAKGSPAVVMSIVFAGAPIVNALVGPTPFLFRSLPRRCHNRRPGERQRTAAGAFVRDTKLWGFRWDDDSAGSQRCQSETLAGGSSCCDRSVRVR
jgi:hypothetical protein